ncbi:DUF4442 domain-containing protein [Tenacibaculum maritimum]|uniref:DUF4442 domain-containing protein n=1 Tax=Tenacibaculum maritimum TaxID=107401 RepID=UPI0023078E40|nr:DUF4442 domain-containing protein [Tenacibaculum maritimum]MDB0611409.1 DUF4442 domain-containing protein [Tenacibaculum maritimum]
MKLTPRKINAFTILKLPAAYFTGVRVKYINDCECSVTVKHRWVNQNPFKSLFWAIQGMAAELATGALVMQEIENSGKKISMLVTNMNATFTKKATGKITFVCKDGELIRKAIHKSIETREGQVVVMKSAGVNNEGISVSKFEFEWSIKLKE